MLKKLFSFRTMTASTSSDDCFAGAKQDFLICTTIHKARDVGVTTSDLYVRVTLDKTTKSTKVFSKSENPFYNEYFVFELNCTLVELLRLTILYELKKRSTCKKNVAIGELLIDMHTVWNQPNHSYFKKWGRLDTPIAAHGTAQEEARGYLQIDLAIVSQTSNLNTLLLPTDEKDTLSLNKWHIDQDYDDIQKNLLQNPDPYMQCNIRYFVTIYRGFFVRKSDYLIQGKTQVAKGTNNPSWNEEITFAWTFPSLAQQFLIQIFAHEHLQWKCVAECEIHFDEIAFKDKPALGPTFIHFYDPINTLQYVGRLLLEVSSESLNDKAERVLDTRIVRGLDETNFWMSESVQLEFLPLQGDFMHTNEHSCRVGLRSAEYTSNFVQSALKQPIGKFKITPSIKYFRQTPPYLSCVINTRMPDNRCKFESDFFMQEIVDHMKSEIETFRLFQLKYNSQFTMHSKCLKSIITGILKKIRAGIEEKRFEFESSTQRTVWDINRQLYLLEYFTKLPTELKNCSHKLKSAPTEHLEHTIDEVLQDLTYQVSQLNSVLIMTRLQDDWPELQLTLYIGSKEFGVCRLNAKHFLNMHKSKSQNLCWRVKSFVFKDPHCQHTCFHCGCSVATVLGCLAIVNETERKDFLAQISNEWEQIESMVWAPNVTTTHFKCHLFIHQAKIRPGSDRSGLCDALLRVSTGEHAAESYTVHTTLSPIWNVVIKLPGIKLPGGIVWYLQQAPIICVELYDADKSSSPDYEGCGMLSPTVISSDRADEAAWEDARMANNQNNTNVMKARNTVQKFMRLKNATPPPLKWVPISRKGAIRAEVLMSAEFVEIFGDMENEAETAPSIITGIPNAIRPNMLNFVLEVMFVGLRNYTKAGSTTAGKHRIKVMMAELVLTSGLSTSRINRSINFLVAYNSGVVSLPDQHEYWPAIIATDVIISSFNNESTVGAALIPNSKNFLQREKQIKCISKDDTEDTSVYTTDVTIDAAAESDADETAPLLEKEHSIWTRLMMSFGLRVFKRPVECANYLEIEDRSELVSEREYSWWTKFYNSMYPEQACLTYPFKHHLVIYMNELEKEPEFNGLHDWAVPIQMVHGINLKRSPHPKEEVYATLKLNVKLTPCQCGAGDAGDGDMLRPLAAAMNPKHLEAVRTMGELCKIIVRVYIVQGLQFNPRDKQTQADSYIKLSLGAKTISDRAHYLPNQSNPIYGKFFEFDCLLPREHMLDITVFDRDRAHDEIIGSTVIDLEDRWRSKHRATVGIANEYTRNGYNHWRDVSTPQEILNDLCLKRDIAPPYFYGKVIEVDDIVFADDTVISTNENLHERLSLTVLKNLKHLTSFGYSLVPEHVETRSLYREDCPGIEQGKLQLWIELYEGNVYIPPPIDITPFPPQEYEVRIIVLNLLGMELRDINIFGKTMSDIYVVGWCQDAHNYQSTDVHYRSFAGEANFNWRMIFPMQYSPTEDMMVVRRKSGLNEEFEIKRPPTIYFQVWDKDFISRDDFLASLELNISNLQEPYTHPRACTKLFPRRRKHINLFRRKLVRGWFPMHGSPKHNEPNKPPVMGGKIELELEVRTQEEAENQPAGKGHDPPNALPMPIRPDTSFNPLTNPLKSLRKVLWPGVRKYVLIFLLIVIVVGAMILFFSNLPYHLLGGIIG